MCPVVQHESREERRRHLGDLESARTQLKRARAQASSSSKGYGGKAAFQPARNWAASLAAIFALEARWTMLAFSSGSASRS